MTDNILWLLLAVHAGILDFFSGGRGPGQTARKQSGQLFFVLNLFYSLQRGSYGFVKRKLYFSKDQEGVQQCKGVELFPGGVQILISIETHIACDFPGGPDHLSPHWIEK